MPELPDVEIFRRRLQETSLNREIKGVAVLDAGILEAVSPSFLTRRLKGRQFTRTRRHGKHLLAAVDGAGWLTLHFGMTGSLQFFTDDQEQPRHCRVRLDFADDGHLAYINVRRLGRVGFVKDAEIFLRDAGLGPDALDPGLDFAAFQAVLERRPRAKAKVFLMDQSTVAGIGNIYSDEILFQAGLNPDAKVADLDLPSKQRLFATMQRVLSTAVAHGAGSEIALDRLPHDFLLPQRREMGVCPRCGTTITRIRSGGRHAYFCPRCQPRS